MLGCREPLNPEEVLTKMSAAEAQAWWEQRFKEMRTGNWDALGGRLLVPGTFPVLLREMSRDRIHYCQVLGVTKEIPCGFRELCFHSAGLLCGSYASRGLHP